MDEITIHSIVKTAVISGFTIAAALIWKEFLVDFIEYLIPVQEQLMYKFGVAVLATVIAIVSIYVILKTEEETEIVIERLTHRNKKLKEKLKEKK